MENKDIEDFNNLYYEMFGEYMPENNDGTNDFLFQENGQNSISEEIDRWIETLKTPEKTLEANQANEIVTLELAPIEKVEPQKENNEVQNPAKRKLSFENNTAECSSLTERREPFAELLPLDLTLKRRRNDKIRSVTTQTPKLDCYFCAHKYKTRVAVAMGSCRCGTKFPTCWHHVMSKPRTPHYARPCSNKRIWAYSSLNLADANEFELQDKENRE